MKKILAIALLSLALGGCSTLDFAGQVLDVSTKSVANPVSKDDLAKIELTSDAVLKGLVLYRRACLRKLADTNCRSNITALQVYTRQIPPYKKQLELFVANDDQINIATVYNRLASLFTDIKNTATKLGVSIKGV
jgi:hypothetical protein